MKKIFILILLMVCMADTSLAHEIPEEFLDSLPFNSGSGTADEIQGSYSSLMEKAEETIKTILTGGLKKSIGILAVCGVCAAAGVFKRTDEDWRGGRIVETAGVCLLLMLTLGDAGNVIEESRASILEINVFSKIMLPLLAMWASCAGKPLSAVGITGGAMVYTNVCCMLAEKLIFILIITYILVRTAGMAGDNRIAVGMADGLKNVLFFIVKICLGGISFYLTLSGCIMSAGDSAAVKTAKAAVSVLPGIGAAIAGITESVVAGAAVIRNSIGALGVMAVLFFTLGPFLKLFLNMVILRIIGIISSSFASKIISEAIDTIANGYAMAIGMMAAAAGGVIMSAAISVLVLGG